MEGQMEDLYYYQKTGITLNKNEAAVVNLFRDQRVTYEDTYKWEIPAVLYRVFWEYFG